MAEPCKLHVKRFLANKEGNLHVLGNEGLPFDVRRIFWIDSISSPWSQRGNHAHRTNHQIFVPIVPPFKIYVKGKGYEESHDFEDKDYALWVPPLNWVAIHGMRPTSVCLVLCSEEYREDSYIRDLDEFNQLVGSV